jgi:hypothetical protein
MVLLFSHSKHICEMMWKCKEHETGNFGNNYSMKIFFQFGVVIRLWDQVMHSGLKFGDYDDRRSIPKTGKTLKTHHVRNASKVVMGCYGSNQSLKICLCFHDRFSEQVQAWVAHLHTCSNFWGKSSCWKSKLLRTPLYFADMQFLFFPLKIW